MIDQWLTAIETLILTAPGNADPNAGALWVSTLERLGETDQDIARVRRFHWDYTEPGDAAPERPFFILTESQADWEKYNLRDLAAIGSIEVAYAEPTLEGVEHKTAKEYFVAWTANLIQSCAERSRSADVAIAAIRQTVFPQRTPRKNRNPDNPQTDFFWAAWEFLIGESEQYRR